MDKIKENGFVIGVVGLAALLVAFLYFWTLSPVFSDMGDLTSRLKKVNGQISKFTRENVIKPTESYLLYKEEFRERTQGALELAKEYYTQKAELFGQFIEGHSVVSDAGAFNIDIKSRIDMLVGKYTEDFPVEEPEEDDVRGRRRDKKERFTVHRMEVAVAEQVPVAMKRYWIIEEIFKTLHELELDGLGAIRFPEPRREDLPTPDTYNALRCQLELTLPPSSVETFLATLFQSERVPFIDVEMLVLRKSPESVIEELIREKEYDRPADAFVDEATFTGFEEPGVSVTIKLVAMDWVGLPSDEDREGDEEK